MRTLRGSGIGGAGKRRTLFVGVVIVTTLVGVTGALAGIAGAQSASATTGVDSCRTIDDPGRYVLTGNVTGGGNCITITASNVTLDGAGHTLSGSGTGHAIHANGSSRAVANVTVRRVQTSNWSVGVFYLGVANGTIEGTIVNNNTQGLTLARSDGNRLIDNTAYANSIGIAAGGESQNNTLRDNAAVENKWGIHFERDSANNTVADNVARNNTRWDYYSLRNGGTNTVTDLRLATTTLSFTERNVGLHSTTSPPDIPQGTRSLGTFVEVTGTGGAGSTLSVTMHYDGAGRSSVAVYRHEGEYWSDIDRTEVDASANTARVENVTTFGTFAPLADVSGAPGGSVTAAADQAGSVQRTLTTVATPATNATTTDTTSNATPNVTTGPNVTAVETTASDTTATTGDPSANTTTATAGTITPVDDASATTTPVSGGSEGTSGIKLGIVRIAFVLFGAVALAVLGVVAVRQSR